MIAVIFEVEIAAGAQQHYLTLAQDLSAHLQTMDGFISIERFSSLNKAENQAQKLLSLSFWRDEVAVAAWRNLPEHRQAQALGREGIFSDYRLRIAEVTRDYGMQRREQAPRDSQEMHSME